MKLWLKALGMCQSTFCAIPFPWHGWDEQARGKMLLCLPLLGLELGVLWWALGALCRAWDIPAPLTAAVLAAWPWVSTGFLHLDGFMDVTDAVRSCRPAEQRRQILKDSHVGAFAVVGVVLAALTQTAAAASFGGAPLGVLLFIPAVSRSLSVLSLNTLPSLETSQYAGRKKGNAGAPFLTLLCLLIACAVMFEGYVAVLGAETAAYLLALRRAYRSLHGVSGDVSGYCITLSELAALAALALAG